MPAKFFDALQMHTIIYDACKKFQEIHQKRNTFTYYRVFKHNEKACWAQKSIINMHILNINDIRVCICGYIYMYLLICVLSRQVDTIQWLEKSCSATQYGWKLDFPNKVEKIKRHFGIISSMPTGCNLWKKV